MKGVIFMFLSYFGMEFNPFDKAIDTKFAFETNDLKVMNNRLNYLKENPGIALFTGNPGMGKTFAIRNFIKSLNPNLFKCVYISMSSLTVHEFYKQLAFSLGIIPEHKKIDIYKQIQETIVDLVNNRKIKVIICIDEAQYLKTDIINDLKILSNFEMDSRNYFTLILTGQPVLNNILNRNIHEALKQRITISYNFSGISKDELTNYINTRLSIAHGNSNIFTPQAIESIYNSCNGAIRIANNIITKSLIIASANEKNIIDNNIVMEAYNDLALG